ncbi:MAG: hypothetical protein FWC64_02745 [Treponema sp.]|nr:hypothetical protein [Treponema sp.]
MQETIIGELNSDYDPDTFLRIVITEGGDISVRIYGKGEFVISGPGGGSLLEGSTRLEVVRAFTAIAKATKRERDRT